MKRSRLSRPPSRAEGANKLQFPGSSLFGGLCAGVPLVNPYRAGVEYLAERRTGARLVVETMKAARNFYSDQRGSAEVELRGNVTEAAEEVGRSHLSRDPSTKLNFTRTQGAVQAEIA